MHPIRSFAAALTAALLAVGVGVIVPPSAGASAPAQLLAWGDNVNGQLAEGLPGRHLPDTVNGLPQIKAIDAGSGHTLALTADGSLWGWGRNNFGQIGDGTTDHRSGPVKINLRDVASMTAGGGTSLALTRDGQVYAWGFNLFGQIGDGTGGPGPNIIKASPVKVPGLDNIKAVASGGGHSYALAADGTVWAWGRNLQGQLGDGTTEDRFRPVKVKDLQGVTSIAAGNGDGFAILADGTVRTWGWNVAGQLGDGTTETRLTSVPVKNLAGVKAISAAYHHTLAVLNDGSVWAWGTNDEGQLGDGTTTSRLEPQQIPGLGDADAVSANGGGDVDRPGGTGFSMALLRDGAVMTWGDNGSGQLGDGTTNDRHSPGKVGDLHGVAFIEAGGDTPPSRPGPSGAYSVVLTDDGQVRSWGDNVIGQLGDGPTTTTRSVPGKTAGELKRVSSTDTGSGHTLALEADGTLWGWGRNIFGQVGDGSTAYRSSPVRVAGLQRVKTYSAGADHSLAVTRNGAVLAWGRNDKGQLGDGTTTDRAQPVPVAGLSGVVAVAAGNGHSLAITKHGAVWAWGSNAKGQLGDGTTTDHPTPLQLEGVSHAKEIAAGGAHSMAALRDGTVLAWGANGRGQLGDGTTTDHPTPITVEGLAGAESVSAANHHSAALLADGTVRAWGANNKGQLGDGSTDDRSTPVAVQGLSQVRAISIAGGGAEEAAVGHGLALLRDGSVLAWGVNNKGQLGDGTTADRGTAVPVTGLGSVRDVDAGGVTHIDQPDPSGSFSVAVQRDGSVSTWGENMSGQLGDGAPVGRTAPTPVSEDFLANLGGSANIVSIEAGYGQTMALTRDGSLWGWGRNVFAQLGDGSRSSRPNPVKLAALRGVTTFDAGGGHGLAVTADGSAYGWGFNLFGQVGDGTGGQGPNIAKPNPVKIPGLSGIKQVVAAGGHSLALTHDGEVLAWGLNAVGELGDGTNTIRFTPGPVKNLAKNVKAIAAGGGQNLALMNDGTVWAWGDGRSGQLGDGANENRNLPVQVQGLTGATAIAVGYHHSVALLADGTVKAWGINDKGQLGDGTTTNRNTPVQVAGLRGVKAIAANGGGDDMAPAGYGFTMALLEDGTVSTWGHNDRGQLGYGTTADSLTPARVPGLTGVKAIVAGGNAPFTRPGPNGAYALVLK